MHTKMPGSRSLNRRSVSHFVRHIGKVTLSLIAAFCSTPLSIGSASAWQDPPAVAVAATVPPAVEERLIRVGFRVAAGRMVDTVVLHSCFNSGPGDRYSLEGILRIFAREKVSAHYLIDREGRIYRLVREEDVAYHAGQSQWLGRQDVNQFSIGIELINHTDDRPTEAQYFALDTLLQDIERRHSIRFLLAHGEIASERRSDPWNFDWSRIADFRNREPSTRLQTPVVNR